jgi:hypothetical protein
VATHWSPIG